MTGSRCAATTPVFFVFSDLFINTLYCWAENTAVTYSRAMERLASKQSLCAIYRIACIPKIHLCSKDGECYQRRKLPQGAVWLLRLEAVPPFLPEKPLDAKLFRLRGCKNTDSPSGGSNLSRPDG